MVSFTYKQGRGGGGNDRFALLLSVGIVLFSQTFFFSFHCIIGLGLPHTDENPYNLNLFNCLGKDFLFGGSLSSDFCPSVLNTNYCSSLL